MVEAKKIMAQSNEREGKSMASLRRWSQGQCQNRGISKEKNGSGISQGFFDGQREWIAEYQGRKWKSEMQSVPL